MAAINSGETDTIEVMAEASKVVTTIALQVFFVNRWLSQIGKLKN